MSCQNSVLVVVFSELYVGYVSEIPRVRLYCY